MDLLRSLLFVPAVQEEMLARALERGADAIVIDLQDSVPPGEKAPLVATISDLLADPEERARLGKAAHAEAKARADWHAHMARNEEIYVAAARARRNGGRFAIPDPRPFA